MYSEFVDHPREYQILSTAIYRLLKFHNVFYRKKECVYNRCNLSNVTTSKNLKHLECGHTFLVWYLRFWMNEFSYNSCPVCMKTITVEERSVMYRDNVCRPKLEYRKCSTGGYVYRNDVFPTIGPEDKSKYPFHCILLTNGCGDVCGIAPPMRCIFKLKQQLWKIRHRLYVQKIKMELLRNTILNFVDPDTFKSMLVNTPIPAIVEIANRALGISIQSTAIQSTETLGAAAIIDESYFVDNSEIITLIFIYWYTKNRDSFPALDKCFIPWLECEEDSMEDIQSEIEEESHTSDHSEYSTQPPEYITVADYMKKISCDVFGWRNSLYNRFYRAIKLDIKFQEQQLIKNLERSIVGCSTFSIDASTENRVQQPMLQQHINKDIMIPTICILSRVERYFIQDCEDVINGNMKEEINRAKDIEDSVVRISTLRELVGSAVQWAQTSNEEDLDYDYFKVTTHVLSRIVNGIVS